MADMFSAITWEARAVIFRFFPLPCFEQILYTNAKDYGSGGPMEVVLRYPTVTCPGCKRPMTPSPPQPVSVDTDLCDVTYTCKNCAATTTRTIKIELGGARAH
jgi:hypothetical protein